LEPEVAAFLKRILTSISLVLLWMLINSTAGIMYGYAFIENGIKLGNIIFYIWLAISLPLLIWYIIRLWKEKIEFDN